MSLLAKSQPQQPSLQDAQIPRPTRGSAYAAGEGSETQLRINWIRCKQRGQGDRVTGLSSHLSSCGGNWQWYKKVTGQIPPCQAELEFQVPSISASHKRLQANQPPASPNQTFQLGCVLPWLASRCFSRPMSTGPRTSTCAQKWAPLAASLMPEAALLRRLPHGGSFEGKRQPQRHMYEDTCFCISRGIFGANENWDGPVPAGQKAS